jgi:hypothetical protein
VIVEAVPVDVPEVARLVPPHRDCSTTTITSIDTAAPCAGRTLFLLGDRVSLQIDFGADARAVQTWVAIQLTPADEPLLRGYLERRGGTYLGILSADYDGGDDDGGETLPVPRLDVDALAERPTSMVLH